MLKTHNGLKLWIECLMIVAMLSLMDLETLGSFMHERIGLALGMLAVVHLALDARMIGPLLRRIGRRDTPVSYTHLDVYKRQAASMCWSMLNRTAAKRSFMSAMQ